MISLFVVILVLSANTDPVIAQQRQEIPSEDPLQDRLIQNEEVRLKEQQKKSSQSQFSPWVIHQLDRLQQQDEKFEYESFMFLLRKYQIQQFKWNPSKVGNFYIRIGVYVLQGNQMVRRVAPNQNEFVIIESKTESSRLTHLGDAYLLRILPVPIVGDYVILRIRKNFETPVFIEIHLQSTGMQIQKGIKDDTFKMPAQKLGAILAQIEGGEREHRETFVNEYSLLEREQKHQSTMLMLTGFELFAILTSAVIQIYCIKNLIDNRIII